MRILALSALLMFSGLTLAAKHDELTDMLHEEAALLKSSILQEAACPTLYTLLQQITSKAGIKMPKSIVIMTTELTTKIEIALINQYSIHSIPTTAHFDFLGDLIISRDILTQFTYHELEGLLSTAAAAKAQYQITKQIFAPLTAASTLAAIHFALQKYSSFETKSIFNDFMTVAVVPLTLLYAFVGRSVQRNADIFALSLTDPKNIEDGLIALARLQNNYSSSSTKERVFAAFHLEKLYKKIKNIFSDENTINARFDNLDKHNNNK